MMCLSVCIPMCVFVSTCSLVLYMLTMTFAATSYAKSPSTVVWIWANTLESDYFLLTPFNPFYKQWPQWLLKRINEIICLLPILQRLHIPFRKPFTNSCAVLQSPSDCLFDLC